MTVKELKKKLATMPDDMNVLVPVNPMDGFDGQFFSPCNEETGEVEMGLDDIDDDEMNELKLLGKEIRKEKSFVLVPCGFYDKEHDQTVELN